MDTGDAAGDAFFGLYELAFPLMCADPHFRRSPGCRNEPILSIPGFNVYTSNVVEADDSRDAEAAEVIGNLGLANEPSQQLAIQQHWPRPF